MKKFYFKLTVLFLLTLISFQINAQKKTPSFSKKEKSPSSASLNLPGNTAVNKHTGQHNTSYLPLRLSINNDSLKNLKIHRSEKGLPISIKGSMYKKYAHLSSKEHVKSACESYLKDISSLIKIKDPSKEFEIESITNESDQKHVRLNQTYSGIPVYGAEIILHFKGDSVVLFNGRHYPTPLLNDIKPVLASSNAIQKAITDVSTLTTYRELSTDQKKLLNYEAPSSELVLYQDHNKENLELTWHVTLRPNLLEDWEYFINAKTGEIINKTNRTCTTGPVTGTATDLNGVSHTLNTYQQGSTFYMLDASKPMFDLAKSLNMPDNPVGAIWTLDAQNTDLASMAQISALNNTSWSDPSAISAHFHAGQCFDYYKSTFNRISLDGDSGTIISVVNVTQGGASMENAYWNGQFMAYGNGGTYFKPLAGGLDVAAHELTHGVISKTANLQYSYQSGAINESMADIFGCMVERNNWQIGEDIVEPAYFPSGALRDLSNPHNGSVAGNFKWQPSSMTEFVNTTSDNGGVHVNSGIPNFAFYLFATSANVGKSVAENVYYRALTTYLVKSSQFIDLRLAIITASDELYPTGTLVSNAARAAFDSVKILDGPPTSVNNNIPLHAGQGYILAENTYGGSVNSLYLLDYVNQTTPLPISTTPVDQKPSITDNGSTAYFVSKDNKIRRINLDPVSPQETIINNQAIWDNVAVSKDGTKLAATTINTDSSIYIFDFQSSKWTRFHLYNPTYTTGIITDGPIYADALEWDYTGEYVIYDCFNKVPAGSSNIDYWDIGILKAWNNAKDSLGDGSIAKLFSELPANVDIGNPTFSKNSTNIIAFDLIDYNANAAYVWACNTETMENNPVAGNYLLGFPSFSNDDVSIAFTSLDANTGDTIISVVDLNSDKISPASNPGVLIYGLEMPVYYAKGSRPTGTRKTDPISPVISVFPNPFEDQIFINYELLKNENVDISVYNTLGQPVRKLFSENQNTGLHKHSFPIEGLSPGTYFIKVLTGSDFQTFKMIRLQ